VQVLAGTSGFSFDAWKGPFYPEKIAGKQMLAFYASRLLTVEINGSFYKLPTEKTLSEWASQVPPVFRFSLKASRYLTHGLRLKDARVAVEHFYGLAAKLGACLGPLFVQVPPNVKKDMPLLLDFLSVLPEGKLVAMELRDPSWRDEAVYGLMRERDVAWVGSESDDEPMHAPETASWSYLRLRKSRYSKRDITGWARRLTAARKDAYVYFKHEDGGLGPALAKQLTEAILLS
jgi:uncharacterized protein YecE (DUF72 family)